MNEINNARIPTSWLSRATIEFIKGQRKQLNIKFTLSFFIRHLLSQQYNNNKKNKNSINHINLTSKTE